MERARLQLAERALLPRVWRTTQPPPCAQKSGTRPCGESTTKRCGEIMIPERATVLRGWSAAAQPQLCRSSSAPPQARASSLCAGSRALPARRRALPARRSQALPACQIRALPAQVSCTLPERGSCVLFACRSLTGVTFSPRERVARPTPRHAIPVNKSCFHPWRK